MESVIGTPRDDEPVSAYSRAAIDEFLAAADAERVRLQAAIAADEERARRARAAIGADRVMVAMLLEVQREIDEIRASAEAEAAQILATAVPQPRETKPDHALLDLTSAAVDPPERGSGLVPPVIPNLADARVAVEEGTPRGSNGTVAADGGEEYFDFLRGALVDDEPLGPRPE